MLPLQRHLQMVRRSSLFGKGLKNCSPVSCIFSVTWLAGGVKEPTHLSKRGDDVPSVVVWPYSGANLAGTSRQYVSPSFSHHILTKWKLLKQNTENKTKLCVPDSREKVHRSCKISQKTSDCTWITSSLSFYRKLCVPDYLEEAHSLCHHSS